MCLCVCVFLVSFCFGLVLLYDIGSGKHRLTWKVLCSQPSSLKPVISCLLLEVETTDVPPGAGLPMSL